MTPTNLLIAACLVMTGGVGGFLVAILCVLASAADAARDDAHESDAAAAFDPKPAS